MKIKAGEYQYTYRGVTFQIKIEWEQWQYIVNGKFSELYYAKKVAVSQAKYFIDQSENDIPIPDKISKLEKEREELINKYIIPIEIELEKLREQLLNK